ncbi:hypothetical protein GN330_17460 [Nitratireductor sp. CAU 1489]|uniref:DUF6305 domain-containing protein n=1 Tax=Nitratireductor arenosus TaxID=2682096 RepID=A0A844QN46_9HYPH|nr:DUF6305 family protein [Nitratireductor arenosus]MVA99039.1 hypothetical protein [Nitratireductor arenosus]
MMFTARLAFAVALVLAPVAALAQDKAAVLVTSSGQALDAFTVKTLLGRAGVANDYDPHATAADLDGRAAVVIAVGASVKGFGAAGITTETEIERTTALIDTAKAAGVKIIGVHIGGAERRQGLSEQFVQLVAPRADSLVVWKTGNADGYFDTVAAEKSIPLTQIDKLTEVGPVLAGEVAAQ